MALYFQRMAPSITSADRPSSPTRPCSKVVQTALGLSRPMSYQSIDQQATLIGRHLEIDDLQNPAKLQKFIERFTANYDAKQHAVGRRNLGLRHGSVGISPAC